MKRREFLKAVSVSALVLSVPLVAENWHGYALIEINTNAPQAHIDTAMTVVGMAGLSATTPFPHQKSVIRASANGRKFIWEVTMKSNEAPSLNYLKYGLTNFTSLTEADVDNMIYSFNILGNAENTRTFMNNNVSEWETIE